MNYKLEACWCQTSVEPSPTKKLGAAVLAFSICGSINSRNCFVFFEGGWDHISEEGAAVRGYHTCIVQCVGPPC